jgi:hypothetical protein
MAEVVRAGRDGQEGLIGATAGGKISAVSFPYGQLADRASAHATSSAGMALLGVPPSPASNGGSEPPPRYEGLVGTTDTPLSVDELCSFRRQPTMEAPSASRLRGFSEASIEISPQLGDEQGHAISAGTVNTGSVDPAKKLTGTLDSGECASVADEQQATTMMGAPWSRGPAREAPEVRMPMDTPPSPHRQAMGAAMPAARTASNSETPTLIVPFHWGSGDHTVTAHFNRGLNGPAMLTPSTPEVRQQLLETPGSPQWTMGRDARDDHRQQREQAQDDPE